MSQMQEPNLTFGPLPDGAVDFPAEERKVQQFWDEERVFEKALEKSKQAGKPEFVWLDGPPFATGDPHYGHLMAGTLKDVVCRFRHQTGWHVPRRFGWDCHGLPLEQLASKKLNLNGRQAVLDFGVTRYCDYCESLVQVTTDAWEKPLRKLGRWCDLENTWKTLDRTFMESVWWVFSELFKKGLVYRAFKVMPYSTGCQTVLSNSEVGQDCYKDVVDKSLLVKFKLCEEGAKKVRHLVGGDTKLESVFMLAWTTTHWTLPANRALAVNPEAKYCLLRVTFSNGTVVNYVCGAARAEWVMGTFCKSEVMHYEVVGSNFLGKDLYKLKYHPLYKVPDHLLSKRCKTDFHSVLLADYVTDSSGTMVVHLCPAYGADDFDTCVKHQVVSETGEGMWDYLDADGNCDVNLSELKFSAGAGESGSVTTSASSTLGGKGLYVKSDEFFKEVTDYLNFHSLLANVFDYEHSYPHCYRSHTPLVYRAVSSWFVKVDADLLLKNLAKTKWVPGWVQENRFHNWVANARDWCVSRNRFWGTPLPLWASDNFDEVVCVSSVAELEELTGVSNLNNLHRQYVDALKVPSTRHPGTFLKRVDDVFDCWFESGCVPYGSNHYPFTQKVGDVPPVPAQFVAEGLDQTRGWFYSLHVLASLLFDAPAFHNLVCNGMLLAEDGQKMSKSKKNYPEATAVMDRKGADALRLYLCSSAAAQGLPLRFSEDGLTNVVKDVLLKWHNVYRLFQQEVARFERVSGKSFKQVKLRVGSANDYDWDVMDQWLLSLSSSFAKFVHAELENYHLYNFQSELVNFLNQLTKWYVPLKRNDLRGQTGDVECLKTLSVLFQVLYDLTVLVAPVMPFYTETMFRTLRKAVETAEVSVHHTMLPVVGKEHMRPELEVEVQLFQQTVEAVRLLRERKQVMFKTPVKFMKVVFQERSKMLRMQKFESLFVEYLNVVDVDLSECLDDSLDANAAELDSTVDNGQAESDTCVPNMTARSDAYENASVLFVPTLKKKKNCVKKKLKKNKVSVEEAEKELEKVSQARLRKFWQTTLATSAECAGTAENSSKAENFPQLMLTFARCVDEDTSADSESGAQASEPANACLVAVTLCREDLDVTPVLTRTSAETCDNKFLETTLDADNNLVMLDFTPSEDFAKMAMCRNLVSHVQRMFKKLDVMHPGAGPRAKVRMVVSADSQSLVETLTDMRTYVVKYLRRNFELSTDNGDSSTHAVQLVEKWGYAEGTCAARVELF